MKIRGILVAKFGGFCRLESIYKGDNNAYVSNFYTKEGGVVSNYWQVHDFGKGYFSHWD